MALLRRVVFVSGTGTEVGKTWVTAAAIRVARRRGIEVHARKPAQSFEPGLGPTDAEILAAASNEDPNLVCPSHRWFEVPMAPPMAAEVLGRPAFTIAELTGELSMPDTGITFVEGAGGPRSPLANDGDSVDLADAVDADVVLLVADAGLGTINAVQLSRAAFDGRDVIVFLNRYDARSDLHVRNKAWLEEVGKHTVVTDCDTLIDGLSEEAG